MKYADYLKSQGKSSHTITAYLSDLKKFDLANLTKKRVMEWMASCELDPKSICRTLTSLKSWLEFAGKKIKLPRHPKLPKKLPVVLTDEEVDRMMKQAKTLLEKVIINLLYDTGARVDELKKLTLNQIEMATRTVLFKRKGNKEGLVPFSEDTKALLKKYLKGVEREVFPICIRTIERIVERLAKRAKIQKNVTPHTFRHSIATHLLEKGMPIRYIQEFLGHANLSTTQIYTHVTREKLLSLYDKYR